MPNLSFPDPIVDDGGRLRWRKSDVLNYERGLAGSCSP